MTNKEIYKAVCEREVVPLFLQYWWLEGVSAGKNWDVLLVHDEGINSDNIVAALPYETRKVLWRKSAQEASFSPYGGVWIREDKRDEEDEVARIAANLSEQLSQLQLLTYSQTFHPDCPMPLAMKAHGYRLFKRRTWILNELHNAEDAREHFSRSKQKKLKNLSDNFTVVDVEAEEFYRFHKASCLQKKKELSYTREMLLVMSEKAMQNEQGALFGVRNHEQELQAVGFLVWDDQTAYLLIDAFDHDQPDNGAREVVIWEAIKRAAAMGRQLDFASRRDYLKQYGAKKHSYVTVQMGGRLLYWWRRLNEYLG